MHDSIKSLRGPIKETVEVKSFRNHDSKKGEFSRMSNIHSHYFIILFRRNTRTNCR